MRSARLVVLAIAFSVVLPASASAEESSASAGAPAYIPGVRMYLGGANGRGDAGGSGNGAVFGFQSYIGKGGVLNGFWGIEVLGVQQGNGFLPILTGDFGLRVMPAWVVRPYLKANFGISFLLIIPVPSLRLGLGVAVPIADSFQLDLEFGARRAFNLFDVNNSLTIGTFEIGAGF